MAPEEFEAAWDAVRSSRGTKWIVALTYSHRNRELTARWELDPESGDIKALDKLASDLGWVEPVPRRTKSK